MRAQGIAEADDEMAGQRHPVHGRAGPPGDLHPHHRQQDRQPAAPPQHLVQQRGLQPPVVGGRAAEAVPGAEQFGEVLGPGFGTAVAGAARGGAVRGAGRAAVGRVREQPGQPVQFDLGLVDARLVQRGIGLGGDQQAQQRQVGPLGARGLGELPPSRRAGAVRTGLGFLGHGRTALQRGASGRARR